MPLNPFARKERDACNLHGNQASAGNRMLIWMLMACVSMIVWHVWTFGVSGNPSAGGAEPLGFPILLGMELRDLLFSNKGIVAELWEVFPYFLVGILIAGYLRTFKIAVKLQATLRRYGVMSVFLASFVGIITPLCACGTITTAISLLFAGIPLAPVMALMATSPLMSPSTYLLTLNDLGPEWTVIRTVSAFSMGIFAGLVTHFLAKRGGFGRNDIFIEGAIFRGDFHDDDYPDERLRCNCRRNFGNRIAVKTGNRFLVFLAKSTEMLWVVGKYVIVGVVIGEVVERYMPSAWIYRFFGQKDPLDIVWVTLATVPVFLHQISASSIIYHIKGSLDGTIDGGAALAFMIGGPVTAIPTMVLFWSFFRKRVFFLYMFVCLSGTLLIAYTFQFLLFTPGVDLGNPLLKGVSSISGGRSCTIVKKGENVRMIMDPGGKGIIATSVNDLDGLGGVLFDTSEERFSAADAGRFDNLRYVANAAKWLEQNSMSGSAKDILVYDLSENRGGGISPIPGDAVLAQLGKSGFRVRTAGRSDTPRITESLLADSGQIWLFFGNTSGKGLSEEELKLIMAYNARGVAALIVPGLARDNGEAEAEANRLSSRFGVVFAGKVDNGMELQVSAASSLLSRASALIGMVLRMVHKA